MLVGGELDAAIVALQTERGDLAFTRSAGASCRGRRSGPSRVWRTTSPLEATLAPVAAVLRDGYQRRIAATSLR
jgi:hypothetical protein